MLVAQAQTGELFERLKTLKQGELIAPFQIVCMGQDQKHIDVSVTISPVRNQEGVIVAASTVARDMTQWMRSQEQNALLLAELDHRVKNTLATIQSIARHTMRGAQSIDAFYKTFEGRLLAVSRTHNLLVQGHWKDAPLPQIIKAELAPYGESRFVVKGVLVRLNARQSIALGLVIHELSTNAAKYGALSVPEGQVSVSWTVTPESLLQIFWQESGGPSVNKPPHKGFGSLLIEHSFAVENQGAIKLEFEPEGVCCTMQFMLDTDI